MKSKFIPVTLFVSMLFVLVGCIAPATPAPTAAVAPTLLPTVAPTLAASPTPTGSLEDQARAEGGQLMIYTSMNSGDLETIMTKFKEAYPFVTVENYRDTGEAVLAKGLTEKWAGKTVADVFELDAVTITSQLQEELLAPYTLPETAAYTANLKDPSNRWTVDRINTVVIAYNTNLVAPSDVPTTWNDLLDPKWKGKMAVEGSDVELLGDTVAAWGQDKAYAFWEGIAAQNPVIVSGHTELANALAAGTYAISPTLYAYRIEKLNAGKMPVAWVRTDPVFAFSTIVGLAYGAPHPATAKLFINWLLSESGQMVIRDLGRIPARPGVATNPPTLTSGLNLFYTTSSVSDNFPAYVEKWKSLFGLK